MVSAQGSQASIAKLAKKYFDFLGRTFPVMCSSDEFHWLPRAEASSAFPDQLEDLSPQSVAGVCSTVRSLADDLSRLPEGDCPEADMDREMLLASCQGLLIELEEQPSWRSSPQLYLSIVFLGLDQALNGPLPEGADRTDCMRSRISQASRLLGQARANLDRIPESHCTAAISMVRDCRAFLQELGSSSGRGRPPLFQKDLEALDCQLDSFAGFLHSTTPVSDQSLGAGSLERTLRDHFRCRGSLEDIGQLAESERRDALVSLATLQKRLDPSRTWLELVRSPLPGQEPLHHSWTVYKREVQSLQGFFSGSVFEVDSKEAPLRLARTPTYLKSLRSSASFSSALHAGQPSCFFLELDTRAKPPNGSLLPAKSSMNRESPFLTAHETIPGHHCLDANRRRLMNPVRRQIESPLFYEGWATYAESLLLERGYLHGPLNLLVHEKRRLWRAVRCLIDLRGHTGELDREQSADLLVEAGFSREAALRQVDRYRLKPGYQLCYTLGCHELRKLKNSYARRLGEDGFHSAVLGSGQLPFHLLEKQLASMTSEKTPG
jgi:hypothetical protein